MKLSVFYEHVTIAANEKGVPAETLFKELYAHGVRAAEIDERGVNNPSECLATCTALGIAPSLYSFFDFPHSFDEAAVKHAIDTALALHTDHIMCVSGLLDWNDETQKRPYLQNLTRFCKQCEEHGIAVLAEDFDALNAPTQTTEQLDELFRTVPNLYFCLDTGNFLTGGLDAKAAAVRYIDKIRLVHLKDRHTDNRYSDTFAETENGTKLYCCPVGSGIVPLADIIKMLDAQGFDGNYVIEHFNMRDMAEALTLSCAYLDTLREPV